MLHEANGIEPFRIDAITDGWVQELPGMQKKGVFVGVRSKRIEIWVHHRPNASADLAHHLNCPLYTCHRLARHAKHDEAIELDTSLRAPARDLAQPFLGRLFCPGQESQCVFVQRFKPDTQTQTA